MPVLEVDDARRLRNELVETSACPGGERSGRRIDGFDFGNSPAEYTPDAVNARAVIFTTTNGTRAAIACLGAQHILVGCFANLTAVAAAAAATAIDVHLVCAGTNGALTFEDCLCAGAIADQLIARGAPIGNDEVHLVRNAWRNISSTPEAIARALHASDGGRNLIAIGMGDDVDLCARVDTCDVVPRLDAAGAFIR